MAYSVSVEPPERGHRKTAGKAVRNMLKLVLTILSAALLLAAPSFAWDVAYQGNVTTAHKVGNGIVATSHSVQVDNYDKYGYGPAGYGAYGNVGVPGTFYANGGVMVVPAYGPAVYAVQPVGDAAMMQQPPRAYHFVRLTNTARQTLRMELVGEESTYRGPRSWTIPGGSSISVQLPEGSYRVWTAGERTIGKGNFHRYADQPLVIDRFQSTYFVDTQLGIGMERVLSRN